MLCCICSAICSVQMTPPSTVTLPGLCFLHPRCSITQPGRREAGDWVINTLEQRILRAPGWPTHQGAGRVTNLERTWKLPDPLAPGPKYSSYTTTQVYIWLFLRCVLSNTCRSSVFLSSISHSGELLDLRRGLWEPPDLKPVLEVQVAPGVCDQHPEGGESCETGP